MTSNYKKNKFDNEELEWAISLMEKEYPREERDTPSKMSKLISDNFDVECSAFEISNFFNDKENFELESKKIEYYENT